MADTANEFTLGSSYALARKNVASRLAFFSAFVRKSCRFGCVHGQRWGLQSMGLMRFSKSEFSLLLLLRRVGDSLTGSRQAWKSFLFQPLEVLQGELIFWQL
ncbi:MAG: hypothetical protein GXP26_09310 [Planctomycetes bacterium]|nr:hypothetical protein [Planctomycetota bacterium]